MVKLETIDDITDDMVFSLSYKINSYWLEYETGKNKRVIEIIPKTKKISEMLQEVFKHKNLTEEVDLGIDFTVHTEWIGGKLGKLIINIIPHNKEMNNELKINTFEQGISEMIFEILLMKKTTGKYPWE